MTEYTFNSWLGIRICTYTCTFTPYILSETFWAAYVVWNTKSLLKRQIDDDISQTTHAAKNNPEFRISLQSWNSFFVKLWKMSGLPVKKRKKIEKFSCSKVKYSQIGCRLHFPVSPSLHDFSHLYDIYMVVKKLHSSSSKVVCYKNNMHVALTSVSQFSEFFTFCVSFIWDCSECCV